MKISEMTLVSSLAGTESIEIVQGGVSMRATLDMLQSALPDANGVYPDVPLNRVTMKRYSGQLSTTPTFCDNLAIIDQIKATAYPVLLDRNSRIVAYLNGNDMRQTIDGLPAILNDWTMQVMLRCGGYYKKYYYNAATNEKVYCYSTKKVRGYKYIRRRFLNCFGGTVETQNSTQMLLSNAAKFSTQNYNLTQYHQFAKNLGANYREIATQDRQVYRDYFWLIEKTFNSQSVIRGICDVDWTWWGTFSQAANGGQSSYAQFSKNGDATLAVSGHKGTGSVTVNNGTSNVTVAPYKWLWRENMLSGPYWILETGYLKKDGVWYKVNDLANIAFTIDANYSAVCNEAGDGTTDGGYIVEDFEDTLIPQLINGSDTTGMCDRYWRQTAANTGVGTVYIPAGVGSAYYGSNLGVSVLDSTDVASYALAYYGGALASDDPTDTIANGTVIA